MNKKVKIKSAPKSDEKLYSHLMPIVDFLIDNGNRSQNDYLWGVNRTGYFCHFIENIDFDLLRNNFEFPVTIKLDDVDQTIDCFSTYSIIRGGMGKKVLEVPKANLTDQK